MTDADGYFSPRNHPQRIIHVDDRDPSKEHSPLLPRPDSPSAFSESQATTYLNGPSSIASEAPGMSDFASMYGSVPPMSETSGPSSSSMGGGSRGLPGGFVYNHHHGQHHAPSIHSISSDPAGFWVAPESSAGVERDVPPPWYRRRWRRRRDGDDAWGLQRHRRGRWLRLCRKVAVGVLVVALLTLLLARQFEDARRGGADRNRDGEHSGDGGKHHGDGGSGGGSGGGGRKDGEKIPLGDAAGRWLCPNMDPSYEATTHHAIQAPDAFLLSEKVTRRPRHGQAHVEISGNVLITAAPYDYQLPSTTSSNNDGSNITADITVKLSDAAYRDRVWVEVDPAGVLRIHVDLTTYASSAAACIDIQATIAVPRGFPFATLAVATETLSITLDSSLDGTAASTELATVAAHIAARSNHWLSVSTNASVVDGTISGRFTLKDTLELRAVTGSIDVTVVPMDSPREKATYIASTTSGFIKTAIDPPNPARLPRRTYVTRVCTLSGAISGQYILGQHAELTTQSGAITAAILPTGTDGKGLLITDSQQGEHNITFVAPLKGKPVGGVHKTMSGRIGVRYPSDWEGAVKASSVSSEVVVRGEGVQIVRDERYLGGRIVEAFKGDYNGGRIEASTISGSVTVSIE